MKYEKVFKPISIKGLKLKNRLVMLPMHLLYTPDGYATDKFNNYYWRRAEGGVGLIMVGGCKFDDYGGAHGMMSLEDDTMIDGWKEFTDGIHKRGSKVGVQLYHAGRYSSRRNIINNEKPLGPSPIYSNFSRETPKEMTKEDIEMVKDKWAQASVRAVKAGFDLIEILASAGYLISQFLSPLTNKRTDEYGGSFENRTRFAREVVEKVRQAVGDDVVIMVRLAGNDFVENSNTNLQAIEIAKLIEDAGADILNITGGWHETTIPQLTPELPPGGFSYLARNIKKAVSIPVIAGNRINNCEVGENILQMGHSDLIGMSRGLLADPDLVKKSFEGREDEIRYCVGCNQGCLANAFFDKPVTCLVNPEAGRENLYKAGKTPRPKNILVLGGGIAGMEFAIRANDKGHRVTIWEKTNRLGGQLESITSPKSKYEFKRLGNFYNKAIKTRDIKLELNKLTTSHEIIKSNFDKVVIATGAQPIILDDWYKQSHVNSFDEVLTRQVIPGKNVIIIGGSSVGCELAMYLGQESSLTQEELFFMMTQKSESLEDIKKMLNTCDRNITIIEMTSRLGQGFDLGCGWPILKEINRLGVRSLVNTKVIDIKDGLVFAEKTNDGEVNSLELPYDNVILALGSRSNNKIYKDLKDKNIDVDIIGDAKKVGRILDATSDALELAERI